MQFYWIFLSVLLALAGLTVLAGCTGSEAYSRATPVRVAVAANFTAVQQELAAHFTEATGITVESSYGATGALYSQIANGAPFHVFLAADAARPERLASEGLAVPGSRFTYAIGALVLYSTDGIAGGDGDAALRAGDFQHLAICKPELAPYGLAAQQALENLGLWETLQPKLVRGDNVAQAFRYTETGNAELGLVALSQVIDRSPEQVWRVPAALYEPIRQDAVLLESGAKVDGARQYWKFLRSAEARQIIASAGYDIRTSGE